MVSSLDGGHLPNAVPSTRARSMHIWATRSEVVRSIPFGTHLVDEVLTMIVAQYLSPNDPMEVCFHQFLDEVYFSEIIERWRTEDIEDANDVLVVEMAEETDLAQRSKRKHAVVEGCYSFDGNLACRGEMDC